MRAIEHNLFFRKCFKSYFWFYLKLGGQTNIVKAISKLSRCAGKTVSVSVIREAYTEKLILWIRTWRKEGAGKGREGTEIHAWRNNKL